MKVRLISYSEPSSEVLDDFESTPDLQDLVAYCARVSNPSNQSNTETSDRLLRYLIKNAHWSPFEMVNMCLEIETTRDIARQILRHRSFSFQEFSQRYADPVKDLNLIPREARLQDSKNRQNSIELDFRRQDHKEIARWWFYEQNDIVKKVKELYNAAIAQGIAKEVARAILPEGLTMSRMYMNGTLRSWIHYIQLRSDNGTQEEHKDVALACAKVISEIFPFVKEYINEHKT